MSDRLFRLSITPFLRKGVELEALEGFEGLSEDELTFKKGDIIKFLEKDTSGWAAGDLGGRIGWFPISFVVPVSHKSMFYASLGLPLPESSTTPASESSQTPANSQAPPSASSEAAAPPPSPPQSPTSASSQAAPSYQAAAPALQSPASASSQSLVPGQAAAASTTTSSGGTRTGLHLPNLTAAPTSTTAKSTSGPVSLTQSAAITSAPQSPSAPIPTTNSKDATLSPKGATAAMATSPKQAVPSGTRVATPTPTPTPSPLSASVGVKKPAAATGAALSASYAPSAAAGGTAAPNPGRFVAPPGSVAPKARPITQAVRTPVSAEAPTFSATPALDYSTTRVKPAARSHVFTAASVATEKERMAQTQAPSQAHSPRTKPVPATYNTLHTTNPSNPTSSSLGADLPSPRPVAMTSPQSRMAPETSTHPASAPATTPINATATTSIPSPAPSPIQLSPIAAAAAVQTPPSWETPSPLSTTSPVGSAASPTGTSPIAAAAEAHSAPPPANEPPKEPYSLSPKDQSAAQKAAARKTRMMNRKTKVVVNEKDFEGFEEFERQYKALYGGMEDQGVDETSILGPAKYRNSVRVGKWINQRQSVLDLQQRNILKDPQAEEKAKSEKAEKRNILTRFFKKEHERRAKEEASKERDKEKEKEKEKERREAERLRREKMKKEKPTIFGQPLSVLLIGKKGTRYSIPRIVNDCISYLSKADRLTEPGLFRISGDHLQIDQLKAIYKTPNDSVDFEKMKIDTHTVAALLKAFFAALPEPIFSYRVCDLVLEATDRSEDGRLDLELCKRILRNMPTIQCLIGFLRLVCQRADKNMMSSQNIALVLGPSLMRPSIETPETLLRRSDSRFIDMLINHYDELFTPQR